MARQRTGKIYAQLRSYRWYGVNDLRAFGHRSRTKQIGFAREDYEGKPVIGIVNTWSEMNPCHVHFRARAAYGRPAASRSRCRRCPWASRS